MKFFLKYNMLIMGGSFAFISLILYALTNTLDFQHVLIGVSSSKNILLYLFSLGLLKLSLENRQNFQSVTYHQEEYSYYQRQILGIMSAIPFGLGVSSFFKGISNHKTEVDIKPMSEGMTASMLIYPSTLASSFAYDFLGMNSLLTLFLLGFPIVFILFFPKEKQDISDIKELLKSKFFLMVFILGGINILYISILSLFFNKGYVFKQAIFFTILALIINPKIFLQIQKVIINQYKMFLFFIAVGLLGHSFKELLVVSNITDFIRYFDNIYLLAILVIGILPIISMFFIHPLVLFVICSPVISPIMTKNSISLSLIYVLWTTMLISSQLLSPISLTSVLSAHNSNSNIFKASFLMHYKYVCKIFTIVFAYFTVISLFSS